MEDNTIDNNAKQPEIVLDQLEDAMNELIDRQMMLDTILESTLAGYWDWHINDDYEFLSPTFKRMFGYKEDELANRPETWQKLIHPDDLPGTLAEYEKHIQSKGTVPYNNEARYFHKDGSMVWVNSKGKVIEWDKDGNPVRMVGCYVNITPQKNLEKQLKTTQQVLMDKTHRLQLSTSNARIGIFDWDILTNTLKWDDIMYDIYGISKDTFEGAFESWQAGVHPDDIEQSALEVEKALTGEQEFNTEFRIVWPDKSIRYIKAVALVERDDEGNPITMLGTNWDVTADKEIERQKIRARQLELKNRELEQFAFIASHDLQEPLRTVTSITDLLRRDYVEKLDEEVKKSLNFISAATERMSQLISGLLEYSRIGSGHETEEIDCAMLVQSILANLDEEIRASNAEIEIGNLPLIWGYKVELGLLFHNLISNAIEFRERKRPLKISISTKNRDGYWEFCVKDNGIGMEKKYYKKIFAIFQRLHKRNKFTGTGVGLAHCQKIANLHGGKIWVQSEVNVGSSFYVTIPINL